MILLSKLILKIICSSWFRYFTDRETCENCQSFVNNVSTITPKLIPTIEKTGNISVTGIYKERERIPSIFNYYEQF
ncbi:MAG: hypothetical protein U0457_03225 [Candidatus Sericytochromatia bacterium]